MTKLANTNMEKGVFYKVMDKNKVIKLLVTDKNKVIKLLVMDKNKMIASKNMREISTNPSSSMHPSFYIVLAIVPMASPEPDPPLDFEDEVVTFKELVGSLENPPSCPAFSQCMKKLDKIPEVAIPCIVA
jgi:hypothetical protein